MSWWNRKPAAEPAIEPEAIGLVLENGAIVEVPITWIGNQPWAVIPLPNMARLQPRGSVDGHSVMRWRPLSERALQFFNIKRKPPLAKPPEGAT